MSPMLGLRRLTRRPSACHERGSATIQMVVLLPGLFTLMFLGVQAALVYQGRTVALAAAQEGARDAAAESGTTAQGITAALNFVQASTAALTGTAVTGDRTPTAATVTVTTHTLSVIPGWSPTITQSASLPVEKITR